MSARDKRIIYIALWVVMNLLIAIVICLTIEAVMLNYCCTMPDNRFYFYSVLMGLGGVSALIFAPIAWKKIYVDGVRGKKYVIKKNGSQKLIF